MQQPCNRVCKRLKTRALVWHDGHRDRSTSRTAFQNREIVSLCEIKCFSNGWSGGVVHRMPCAALSGTGKTIRISCYGHDLLTLPDAVFPLRQVEWRSDLPNPFDPAHVLLLIV